MSPTPRRLRDAWLIEHPMCAGWRGSCCAVADQAVEIGEHFRSLCAGCRRKKALEDARAVPPAQDDQPKLW